MTSEIIKSKIRTIPNFPKEGIMFRDITTLLQDAKGFKACIDDFYNRYKGQRIDAVVGIDSRGFIIGGALAYLLGKGFVPIRKKGKLPHLTICEKYDLEYGSAEVEIHKDALKKGDRVVIIDDLIATAGTMMAAISLVKTLGGNIVECAVIIELPDLHGRQKLEKEGCELYSQAEFEGD